MWGLLAGFARQQPPLLAFATEIPNEPNVFDSGE
jgi:hypothetical protein